MSADDPSGPLHSIAAGVGLDGLLSLGSDEDDGPCDCELRFEGDSLQIDASDCDGDLANAQDCRQAIAEALTERSVQVIVVESDGKQYRYTDAGVALLGAAGRFVDLMGDREPRLVEEAREDPLAVAAEVSNRVGPVGDIGAEAGLLHFADADSYRDVFAPRIGISIGYYYAEQSIGESATLSDVATLDTGTEARIYERSDGVPLYMLDVVDLSLSAEERRRVLAAYEAIAEGEAEGERAATRAIEQVSDQPVEPRLTRVLRKHTSGYGILEDLFSDPRISDVYVTSPVARNPLRVEVDGDSMTTNVYLTENGAETLGSRVRRTSGRSFSRAAPTVAATADLDNGTGLRVAGVTDPVAEGVAFAFRERADDRFTLPGLVANETMSAEVAGFLSLVTERNAAALIAGTRGAGKTTLLGTLLYELSPDTRTVVIEDTPELPVEQLQEVERDVQALRTGTGEGPEITPADALRTALRLGDGALVVGEIRGEEAQVLYEAMRVGANANAVLGTIHGDGASDVYERVVSDLDVVPTSFASTDLVVTVQAYREDGERKRRVARVEEVMNEGEDVWFESIYDLDGQVATQTGRLDRGEARILEQIAGPSESYADVREAIDERRRLIDELSRDGRTAPHEITTVYARRGGR